MTGLIRAEMLKITSVRRTWFGLIAALVLGVATLVVTTIFFGSTIGDEVPATSVVDRIEVIAGGTPFVAIVLGVLGAVFAGSEFRTRNMVPALVAVPRRGDLMVAKYTAAAIFTLAAGIVFAAVLMVVGMIGLDIKGYPVGLGDDDMARILVGMALVPMLYALYGLMLGFLFANTTPAVAVLIIQGVMLEPAVSSFTPDWISRYLPFAAVSAAVSVDPPIDPFEGLAVMALWIAALSGIAYVLFNRRDVN